MPAWPPVVERKTDTVPQVTDNSVRSPQASVEPSLPPVNDAKKAQARQMLAEADKLMKEGRLLEARQKCVEVQKISVAYGVNEPGPNVTLMQLQVACQKRIDALIEQASNSMASGSSNPAGCQRAETDLNQARSLAVGFRFDTKAQSGKGARVERRGFERRAAVLSRSGDASRERFDFASVCNRAGCG